MSQSQIIALGGGGFSMEPDNPLLDRYILAQARQPNPVVCFLPTASGDSESYIARFYAAFSALPCCRPRHLSLFKQPPDLATFVSECDILYVGGGNTRNMLAIWRACGIDLLLRKAWENGTVLCGVSAGAICWFERALTDSWGPLAPMSCLGFLRGSCSPHYDGELERRPCFHKFIQVGRLPAGYALDDGAAIHFVGQKVLRVISSRPAACAYQVRMENSGVVETPLQSEFLGTAQKMN
jgi:dipeptidase E